MIVTSKDGVRFHINTRAQSVQAVFTELRYAASKTAAELEAHGDYQREPAGPQPGQLAA